MGLICYVIVSAAAALPAFLILRGRRGFPRSLGAIAGGFLIGFCVLIVVAVTIEVTTGIKTWGFGETAAVTGPFLGLLLAQVVAKPART